MQIKFNRLKILFSFRKTITLNCAAVGLLPSATANRDKVGIKCLKTTDLTARKLLKIQNGFDHSVPLPIPIT